MKSQKTALTELSIRYLSAIESGQIDRNANGYNQWDIEDLDLFFDSAKTKNTYRGGIIKRVWNLLNAYDNPINEEAEASKDALIDRIQDYCGKYNILELIK